MKLSWSIGSLPLPFSFPLAEWMNEWTKELFLLCCNQFSLWPHDRRWQHIVPEFLYVVSVRTESTSVVPILTSNFWEGEKLVVWSIWLRESWNSLPTPGYHDMTVGTGGVQGTVFAKQILGRKSHRFLQFLLPFYHSLLHNFGPVPSLSCPRFETASPCLIILGHVSLLSLYQWCWLLRREGLQQIASSLPPLLCWMGSPHLSLCSNSWVQFVFHLSIPTPILFVLLQCLSDSTCPCGKRVRSPTQLWGLTGLILELLVRAQIRFIHRNSFCQSWNNAQVWYLWCIFYQIALCRLTEEPGNNLWHWLWSVCSSGLSYCLRIDSSGGTKPICKLETLWYFILSLDHVCSPCPKHLCGPPCSEQRFKIRASKQDKNR